MDLINCSELISDDYEEGEILDDDDLYDEVSSFEEFSSEDKESQDIKNILKVEKKVKQHKKKEHRCKEDSVCRKERKGKLCYARIRMTKQTITNSEAPPQPIKEENLSCRKEVTPATKKVVIKSRHIPPSRIRQENCKSSNTKDFHEKENRYSNKKQYKQIEKTCPRRRYPEKALNRSKTNDHNKSKYSNNSSVLGTYKQDSHIKTTAGKNISLSKTSLLKRLVGSGTVGVKTLKENEIVLADSQVRNCETSSNEVLNSESFSDLSETKKLDNIVTDKGLIGAAEKEATICLISPSNEKDKLIQCPDQDKKTEEELNSAKDDSDELSLRVEALKSAWVKKFNERKKKGLVCQRKTERFDDSLVDFVIDDIDRNENESIDPSIRKTISYDILKGDTSEFISTDLSGDKLKPEDMIIVTHDTCSNEPIICEPALRIVTMTDDSIDSTGCDSSVFIASSSTLFPGSCEDKILFERSSKGKSSKTAFIKSVDNCSKINALKGNTLHIPCSRIKNERRVSNNLSTSHEIKTNSIQIKRERKPLVQRHSNRSERRRTNQYKRRVKKKIKRESLNLTNSGDLEDETLLREQALLTLKSKTKKPLDLSSESNKILSASENNNIQICKSEGVAQAASNTLILSVSDIPTDRNIKKLCELEGNGTASLDNWEDDLDEDILRAQLLSAMTKQVSESSCFSKPIAVSSLRTRVNIELMPTNNSQIVKKVINKKQEKRRLKTLNKKLWKNNHVVDPLLTNIQINNSMLRLKHYGKVNAFVKNDVSHQVRPSNQNGSVLCIPQVPKMIISLGDSDSCSDTESEESNNLPQVSGKLNTNSADIEANIDLLLREAERNVHLQKFGSGTNFSSPAKGARGKDKDKKVTNPSTFSSTSTPQALKHLPAWQQDEYRRLKEKIAEKEKVLQGSRAKAMDPLKDSICVNSTPFATNRLENIDTKTERNTLFDQCNTYSESRSEVVQADIRPICKINDDISIEEDPVLEKCIIQFADNDSNVNKNLSENNSNNEKNYNTLLSCSIMEEINVMNDIVNEFDKNSSEYNDIKTKFIRLNKVIKATELKMSAKKKKLLQIKDNIKEKERGISSKISSLTMAQPPSSDKINKPPNRDMELIKLKYKELSLRAQFLFHDFSTESTNPEDMGKSSDAKDIGNKMKCNVFATNDSRKRKQILMVPLIPKKEKDIPEHPAKRSFSGKERERGEWDPNTPVCHYDLNGICKDEECHYQHFKTV